MINKILLLTAFVFFGCLKSNTKEITENETIVENIISIEDIRKEVNTLEKSLLGISKINKDNSPILYKFVENLVEEMQQKMPEIFVSRGLFTPQTRSEHKLDILLEIVPINLLILLASLQFIDLGTKKIENFEIRVLANIVGAYILSKFFGRNLLGLQKTNAFSMKEINGKSTISLGMNLINDLDIDELENIIAHELAHIKHNHSLKLNLFLLPLLYLRMNPTTNSKWNNFTKNKLDAYFIIIPALSFLSRLFEKEADLTAVNATNKPEKMISALEKIGINHIQMGLYLSDRELVEPIKNTNNHSKIGTFFNAIIGTHPTLEQRTKYLTEAAQNLV